MGGGGDGGRGEGKKMEERTLGSFLKGRGRGSSGDVVF